MHRSRLTRSDEIYWEESRLYAIGNRRQTLPPEIASEFANRLHRLGLHRWDEELGATAGRHARRMRTSVAQLIVGMALLAIGLPLLAYKASAWIARYLEFESGIWELLAMGAGVAIAAVVIISAICSLHASSERVIQSLMILAHRIRDLDRRIDASERT